MADDHDQQTPAQPATTTQAPHKHGDVGEILNPTEVPLVWGCTLKPFPAPHASVYFHPMKWSWFPGFAFDVRFFLFALSAVSTMSFSIILNTVDNASPGKWVGASVLPILAGIAGFLRLNIAINQTIRTAICRCYAKRAVAIAVWENAEQKDLIYAKDVFHAEKSFFYDIVVL